jgi:hypothetical protein
MKNIHVIEENTKIFNEIRKVPSIDPSVVIGITFSKVENLGDSLRLTTHIVDEHGKLVEGSLRIEHHQDCCEEVTLDEVSGELEWLVDAPITHASLEKSNEGEAKSKYDESFTWSFVKLTTIKGSVDLKFYGTSNGYYSESVDFYIEKGITEKTE